MLLISLAMIVKNEEATLAHCLESVKPLADEMIIIDTGSTDKTIDIARDFGAQVYDFKWRDDFAAARNESLKYCKGDWVLILDADEAIDPMDYEKIRNACAHPWAEAYELNIRHYMLTPNLVIQNNTAVPNRSKYNEGKNMPFYTDSPTTRLVKMFDGLTYTGSVHETFDPLLLFRGKAISKLDAVIHHYGKLFNDREEHKTQYYFMLAQRDAEKKPDDIVAQYFLMQQALVAKQWEVAISAAQANRKLGVNTAFVLYGGGQALQELGRHEEAIKFFDELLIIDPKHVLAMLCKGSSYRALGNVNEARRMITGAIELDPAFIPAYGRLAELELGLAETYKNQQKFDEAIIAGRRALELDPENPRILLILGSIYAKQSQYENAIPFYRMALVLDPDSVHAHMDLGLLLHRQGKTAEARSHFRTATKLDPENLLAKLANCMAQIPLIHRSTEEIVQARENYRKALEELCNSINLKDPVVLNSAKTLAGFAQPFFLTYQGKNDRELQAMYGDLMVRIQAACFPEWDKKPQMTPVKSGEPIRVGILSGFFYRHSVWKIPIKGWVENLNRKEFQLYGYHTGWTDDDQTEIAKKSFYRFTEKLPTMEDWLKRITDDKLHVLIIPEIGMDYMTPRLAAFRLAPVQCASLGHPDTTGFPTIDYYLSSDLMEPENGQDHYCEKLVRLPNLSIYYEPLDTPTVLVNRAHFGLRDDLPLFICTQSLFKYLPQYDEVFPRIAIETGACQFAFLGNEKSSTRGELFLRRLEAAFSRFSLRMEDFVKMLPSLDTAHYHALNQLADVFLNSMGWSGFNTTMEALACNLPVVNMPDDLMRGRHTHAILKMMDLSETESRNMDEYVAIAARLAKEPAWRKEISEKIARNRHMIYRDMECIRGLEDFIRQAVAQAAVAITQASIPKH